MHEILAELRAIHDDLRVSETTQLLVAELRIQQNVVSRDTESVDTASAKLDEVRRIEKQEADHLEQAEDRIDKTTNAAERNNLSGEIAAEKSNIIAWKEAEHDCSMTLQPQVVPDRSFGVVTTLELLSIILRRWVTVGYRM